MSSAQAGLARPASRARPWRERVRKLRDGFPLTPLGVAILALSGLALGGYGIARADLVLLAAGLGGVGVVLASLSATLIGAWRVRRALAQAPAGPAYVLEEGQAHRTGLVLPRFRFLPLVRVRWGWARPRAKVHPRPSGGWLEEEVVAERRGLVEGVRRRVEVGDGLGLSRVILTHEERRGARSLPSTGGLRHLQMVRSLASGGDLPDPLGRPEGDRLDLRQYVPGDPIRFVLWNIFARTRSLVVRTPERALAPVHRTLAYLVVGEGDEAAAGAARLALEAGALGQDWAFGADGTEGAIESRDAALDALCRSADVPSWEGGRGLASFIASAGAGRAVRTLVFAPPKPGPFLDNIEAAAARAPRDGGGRLPLEVLVCTDGIAPASAKRGLLAATRPDDRRVSATDLAHVTQRLARLGVPVYVLDRRDGRAQRIGGGA